MIRYTRGSMVNVTLARGSRTSGEYEWLRSSIEYEWESPDTALISIPIGFVTIFNIPLFVLDDREIERRRRNVEMWSLPFSPHVTRRKVGERVGSVRI